MLRISEIRLIPEESLDKIPERIKKKIGLKELEITSYRIVKESVDARKRYSGRIKIVCSADFTCSFHGKTGEAAENAVLDATRGKVHGLGKKSVHKYEFVKHGKEKMNYRPVVVGFGPCGMMAALVLAQSGYKPVVIERGKTSEERIKDVELFWNEGILNEESNVQFGEGGAGTFSDGKLTTQIHDVRIMKVLEEFAQAGAPKDILYRHKPHIGTDILRDVVSNIRKTIIECGGTVMFEKKMTGISHKNGNIKSIEINDTEVINSNVVILALGHSARDTLKMLYDSGVEMAAKSFSMGVRIEHLQKEISLTQYGRQIYEEMGEEAVNARLGAAEYKLSYHCKNGRGVYTFCMCPGGYVVSSSSEAEGVVTNGMSYRKRDGENANSAILVSVSPEDYETDHPLSGIDFQKKYEHLAFINGGSNYCAPYQFVGDFLNDRRKTVKGKKTSGYEEDKSNDISEKPGILDPDTGEEKEKTVAMPMIQGDLDASLTQEIKHPIPTYLPGVKEADLSLCLPDFVVESLNEAIPKMAKKMKGFDSPDAVMTGVETRSSSPVRILRNDEMQSTSVSGIYPGGEGSGYAGGIVSSAVDGIKIAEKIIEQYSNENL